MHKLLIADNDRWALHALAYDLCESGVRIEIADELRSVAGRVQRENIDIVLLGWHSPGLDAIAVLRALKEKSPQTVRLLFGSASELAQAAGSIKDLNVFRLIRKPWAATTLVNAIRDANSFRTMEMAAMTAIMKMRSMDKTSEIRPVGTVDFGPNNTIVLDPEALASDFSDLDFGKSSH